MTVRANRFVNANERSIQIGGSTGFSLFRPQPPGDVEASNIVVEGNLIVHNDDLPPGTPRIRAAVSFINVRDGICRYNVIVRPRGCVVRILKENRRRGFVDTQSGQFLNNVVVWSQGDLWGAVDVGRSTSPKTFLFKNNQWYNTARPARSTPKLPSRETDGIYGVDPNIDPNAVIPWSMAWGKWLINTTETELEFRLEEADSLLLASPGEKAVLDIARRNPLQGEWTLAQAPKQILVSASSHVVLVLRESVAHP